MMQRLKWGHLLVIISCAFSSIMSCGSPASPEVTYTPTPAQTARPTRPVIPTPAPWEEETIVTARNLCADVSSQRVPVAGTVSGKVLVFSQGADDSTWTENTDYAPTYARARSVSELAAVACFKQYKKPLASYSDGGRAYKVEYDVWVVSWPNGEVLVAEYLSSDFDEAPAVKSQPGDIYFGYTPDSLTTWLGELIPAPEQQVTYLESPSGSCLYWVAVSPNGKLLAASAWGETVDLWNMDTYQHVATLTGPKEDIYDLAFSPDGNTLVTAYSSGRVRGWNVETRQEETVFTNQKEGYISSIAFSPDGKTLTGGSFAKAVILWDVGTGTVQGLRTDFRGSVKSVAFSPDGQWLAAADRAAVRVWNIETGETINVFSGAIEKIAFSPDGGLLALGSTAKEVILWEIETGREIGRLEHYWKLNETAPREVVFSPDGALLASIDAMGEAVVLWEVETGRHLGALENELQASDLVFSPDGRLLIATVFCDVVLWELPQY